MIFETMLFFVVSGAALSAGISTYVQYFIARKRGPQMPKSLRGHRPPGSIQPALDARRQKAIEIGRRELGLPDSALWDREFHQALDGSGGAREAVERGDYIIEHSFNGAVQVEYQQPDRYALTDCTCGECEARKSRSTAVELYVDKPKRMR